MFDKIKKYILFEIFYWMLYHSFAYPKRQLNPIHPSIHPIPAGTESEAVTLSVVNSQVIHKSITGKHYKQDSIHSHTYRINNHCNMRVFGLCDGKKDTPLYNKKENDLTDQ